MEGFLLADFQLQAVVASKNCTLRENIFLMSPHDVYDDEANSKMQGKK